MKNLASLSAIGALLLVALGSASAQEPTREGGKQKVLGIGGLFFRAENPTLLAKWYETNLGVSLVPTSYGQEPWHQEAGPTVFAPFEKNTTYFGRREQGWMVNFRVADLKAMVAQLRAAGVDVEEPKSYPNGDFARLYDPEGNPIELWEPKEPEGPEGAQGSQEGQGGQGGQAVGAKLPELALGSPIPEGARKSGSGIMVSPAQFRDEWIWVFDGVEYSIGADSQGTVRFLATQSTEVATEEGVRVGQPFAQLQRIEGVRVLKWPGWGYVAKLPSGWNAAFFLGPSMTEREPVAEDAVALLFRGTSAG